MGRVNSTFKKVRSTLPQLDEASAQFRDEQLLQTIDPEAHATLTMTPSSGAIMGSPALPTLDDPPPWLPDERSLQVTENRYWTCAKCETNKVDRTSCNNCVAKMEQTQQDDAKNMEEQVCMVCQGCVRPPGHEGLCVDGQCTEIIPKAPRMFTAEQFIAATLKQEGDMPAEIPDGRNLSDAETSCTGCLSVDDEENSRPHHLPDQELLKDAAELIEGSIGLAVPASYKGRGIPLRLLTRDHEVAWEVKTRCGKRLRTKAIGGSNSREDLSDFENKKKLPSKERVKVTVAEDATELRSLVKSPEGELEIVRDSLGS